MKKITLINYYLTISFLFLSFESISAENAPVFEGDAIKTHLSDASKLNRKRALDYSKLSDGQSLALSYELIAMEHLGLLLTKSLDDKARKYGDKGVGLFHQDLVDMKLTPIFRNTFVNNDNPTKRIHLKVNEFKNRWLILIKNDDLDALYQELVETLEKGKLSSKNQNCLTRHFVESIAKGLFNLEKHRLNAQEVNLDDPKELLLKFIKLQITTLNWAYSLDKRAFFLQQKNIPIFCQDVPPIDFK